nr:MAG TPA: hypothetical protein [Caudoviricetes sp.]
MSSHVKCCQINSNRLKTFQIKLSALISSVVTKALNGILSSHLIRKHHTIVGPAIKVEMKIRCVNQNAITPNSNIASWQLIGQIKALSEFSEVIH